MALSDFFHLLATGHDAVSFLQGQLTNDLKNLPPNQWQLSAWCNPQGRIKTVLWVWHDGDSVHLILPHALKDSFLSDIQRYVMRSDVRFQDADDCFLTAVIDPHTQGKAMQWKSDGDTTVLHYDTQGTLRCTRTPDTTATAPQSDWYAHLWQCGYAWIFPPLCEQFIPQMLGFCADKGLSFSKGCYPGQEIIARMHYRGQNKRHLYRCRVDGTTALGGKVIRDTTGDVGHVLTQGSDGHVLCVLIDDRTTECLTVQEHSLTVINRVDECPLP